MKTQTKIITDNVAYRITLSRRKRTHKMGYNIKGLPRYKQGVFNYYTLYCKVTDWWCGGYSKYSIMKMYKQHIK